MRTPSFVSLFFTDEVGAGLDAGVHGDTRERRARGRKGPVGV